MKLVLLGTTGYHPNNLRHTACMVLPELGVVFDAGTAMFRLRDWVSTSELDIFLSHAHLDHVVGLTFMLGTLHDKDLERITVHGEVDKLAAVREHLFNDLLFPIEPRFEMCPLRGPVEVAGGGRMTYFPLEHPGGAVGFRLDIGQHSMAYVTDTTAEATAPYVEHIQGVNLLVHECYFDDGQQHWAEVTGHSHTTPVAEVARAAGVGQLVLVHLNPLIDQVDPIGLEVARAIFPRTVLGTDLLEVEF